MGKPKGPITQDDLAGLQEKGYSIIGDLGEGTYSKVKHATWQKPGEGTPVKVALKIINKKTAPKDFLEKFLPREIDIMKKLKHPNLIRLYELFQIASKVYFTLEWGGHGDLLQYIRLRGPITENEARRFFQEMCDGVDYMHGVDIIHRDLKCENVLLTKKNLVKIADFGFARVIRSEDISKTYCGSAAYAAPELLQGIPYKGPIADIWSLGVILYIMSCSSMPFRDTNIKTLVRDQREPLHVPSRIATSLNPSLKDLLVKVLYFDIQKRYSMKDIKNHPWYLTNSSSIESNLSAGSTSRKKSSQAQAVSPRINKKK